MNSVIIYLMGFAGTGKLTIAEEIAKVVDIQLVDNHLINNPVFSLIKLDGVTPIPDKVWKSTWAIRHIVLNVIKEISAPELSFIFTNELVEGNLDDKKLFSEIAELAEYRKSKFLPIRLECTEEEICKRIISKNRKLRFKDMNIENVKKKYNSLVFFPQNYKYLTLDVTNLTAKEAAKEIINYANCCN